ncbi:MAG: hypothetical protein ACR2NP_07460 [Pirellulaceae bacterium]
MDDSRVTVQRFSWPDLIPSLLIFRALPAALSMTILILSLFAVAATPIGWIGAERVFVNDEVKAEPGMEETVMLNRSPYKMVFPKWSPTESLLRVLGAQLSGVELVFRTGVDSLSGIFSLNTGLRRFMYFFTGGIWTLIVWCFFGCAITRAALMRFTRDEPIGIDDAFDYAIDKFLACFGGIMIPLLAVFGLAVPLAILGLVMTTNLGAAIGGFLWFIVLFFALAIAIILLGLTFAWPLIIASISAEGQDSFDGMTRAFSYVFQRPLHYFLYALIAVIFTGICWAIAGLVIQGTIHTASWAVSWGANVRTDRMSELTGDIVEPTEAAEGEQAAGDDGDQPSTIMAFGQRMMRFWNGVAMTFGAAFLYGLFWCVAAAMYVLLRKDLDDAEMDEIFLVDERRAYELPPLKDDESGVPQVDEDAPAGPASQPDAPSAGESDDES